MTVISTTCKDTAMVRAGVRNMRRVTVGMNSWTTGKHEGGDEN